MAAYRAEPDAIKEMVSFLAPKYRPVALREPVNKLARRRIGAVVAVTRIQELAKVGVTFLGINPGRNAGYESS